MKQTIHANIGSQPFVLDMDAYEQLKGYLADIRVRLSDDEVETMDDIEARIAEIFRERLGVSPMRVVAIELVRDAMAQMGSPSDFGERTAVEGEQEGGAADCSTPRKLFRSRSDRSIGGVCGGVAIFFDADPTLIRLITLFLILFGGLSLWIYVILWILIPQEPIIDAKLNIKK